MDNRANLHDSLFSRNSTPPTSSPQHQPYPPAHNISNNSSPNLIDTLFSNISAPPPPAEQVQVPAAPPANSEPHPTESYHDASGTTSVMSLPEETPISPNSIAERQNSLLTLIGAPAVGRPQPQQQQPQQQQQQQQVSQQQQQQQPQQVPTPPGSSQRSNASPPQADAQKILEQMIGGTTSRSTTYSDPQRNSAQQQSAPSPPFTQRDDYRNFNQYEQGSDTSPRTRTIPNPHIPPQAPQPPQIQPPSPRRSMFEFTSAFDHLSLTAPVKKKPVPTQPSATSSGTEDLGSWASPPDPKRQSVENLLENLTRGQAQPIPPQPQPPVYDSYMSGGDYSQQVEQSPSRAPLPPIPAGKPTAIPNRTSSPRGSSPKNQTLHRPQPRTVDVPSNQQSSYNPTNVFPPGLRSEKDGSPGPRGSGIRQAKVVQPQPPPLPPQAQPPKYTPAKTQSSPAPQSQYITFDVSLPLDEIQAKDSVKWTPIALVKQDAIFLPGTTIGATHWVAYAMTRGRVRVISRSSGDRTLLQLPQVFSTSTSVIDMAVFGNRLAGVTSDGGFVVWELPDVITDDVPGRVLLCVPPTGDHHDAIRAVKWHPKEVDTLAIAADDRIFVIDLANTQALHGQPLPHSDLHHIGQLYNVHSPIVAFDFDVVHYALATITEDSSLTVWNMHDGMPYSVNTIRGDDVPSSLTFVDGGIVVGRRNGTVFQLLSAGSKAILSTINFLNGNQEDYEMFGHITYDSRIQTLWVANSRRESLIALKLHIESSYGAGEDTRGHIEQVIEFSGIKPTIHFVILTGDADPHGDEAHAACIAAKIPPGELALVGFSVHSTGVDQVLIRKEWYEGAVTQPESKFPFVSVQHPIDTFKASRQPLLHTLQSGAPSQQPFIAPSAPPRARTPPSDDVENEFSEGRSTDQKSKGSKSKNVNWKEKDEAAKDKDKGSKTNDAAIISDSNLGQALSREIKKTEENLHSRIGKLIGKEMDKQHQRFEETRLHEQAEDFARQEKILKLISTELTRNTTRVVEMAVKSEVQNSVLPSLENITRNEVKNALNEHIGHGLVEAINRGLPTEMEKLLLRPNISNHFANIMTTALTPVIEHQIKEILTTSFFQFHQNQTAGMHQELMREMRNELATIKSDFSTWTNESVKSQEATIRELEHMVRSLDDQVKYLSMGNQPPPPISHIQHQPQQPQQQQQNPSAGPSIPQQQPAHMRQPNIAPVNPQIPAYIQHSHPSFPQQAPPPQQQQPTHIQQQQWYGSIAAPQASVPATLPQAPVVPPPQERTPPLKPDQWDESYLSVLHAQDPSKLRDLLARTNPDVVLPLNGTPLVSQAVILTLIHRLSAVVGDTAPNDETFKSSLWWLQRVASLLRPEDKLIADFIPRVIPTVQQSLNTTKQRLAILPGGLGTMETARALSDIQESLRRKIGQQ